MRIRRRPPASQAPDPCLQIQPSQHPQNVTQETTQHPPGTTPLLGLHPDVDLSLDPHPSCIPSLNPNLNQAVADKLELEEEEEEDKKKRKKKKKIKKGDVDATKIRDFHVNSNNKSGGRVLLGEKKAKAKGVVNTSKTSDEAVVNVSVKEEEEEERVKKRRSPAVLMEGSRCSRVNGRGWRCCQQTLVGYSLCEHHLGKGRLRSMSSVRGQLGSTRPIKTNAQLSEDIVTSSSAMTERINGNEDGEKPENKCKKIGIVKARSISSLLG